MNDELIKREALIKRIELALRLSDSEIVSDVLEDCRAALSQREPVRYVPMTDAERNEMMARWYENHELPSISQYIEAEVIRHAIAQGAKLEVQE